MDKSEELKILLQKKQTYEQQLEHINQTIETNPDPKLADLKERLLTLLDFINSNISSYNVEKDENRSSVKTEDGAWSVGDECEALYAEDNLYYPAIISSIDEFTKEITVVYLGYGTSSVVEQSHLRPLSSPLKDCEVMESKDLQKNADCRVRSLKDGKLYDCIIQNITEDSVTVLYKKSKEVEVVRKQDIKKKPLNPYEATTLDQAPKILPTDSDRVRKHKKRVIDRIKYQMKQKETEEFFQNKQNSWKNFQKKSEKKKTAFHAIPSIKESKPTGTTSNFDKRRVL